MDNQWIKPLRKQAIEITMGETVEGEYYLVTSIVPDEKHLQRKKMGKSR